MENIKDLKGTQIEETVQETLTYDMEGMENEMKSYTKADMMIAAGSGLLVGAGTGGTAVWFLEKRKRNKLLKAIEEHTEIMYARLKYDEDIKNGNQPRDKFTIGKKDIDLRDIELDGTEDIVKILTNNMKETKLNKKELSRWKKQMEDLTEITNKVAVRFEKKGKVTETL